MRTLISLLFFIPLGLHPQDTIYLDKDYKEVQNKKSAKFYQITKPSEYNEKLTIEEIFALDNTLKIQEIFKNYHSDAPQTIEKLYYYDNENVRSRSYYKNNGEFYEFTTFWENGVMRRRNIYIEGKLKNGWCWDNEGKEIPFFPYETAPEFPGGEQVLNMYLTSTISQLVIPKKFQGRTLKVKFNINEQGIVENAVIVESIYHKFEEEIISIIENMPPWKSGTREGEPAVATKTLPIRF